MHGRPRKPATEGDSLVVEAKIEKLRTLQKQLLHNHRNRMWEEKKQQIHSSFFNLIYSENIRS